MSGAVPLEQAKRPFRFVPVVARSNTIYRVIGPIAYDLYLDRDYVIDQVFGQHAAILTDRFEAEEIIAAVYADPVQVLRLGSERVGYLGPWLDALSLDGPGPDGYYRLQALLFAVLDVIVPYIRVTASRQSATQRKTTCPTLPRHRQFRPLRREAHEAAELLSQEPERQWMLADIANAVHLSPSQLGRVFVDAYGKSPIAYLTMIRAERLADLLRTTDEPSVWPHGTWAGPTRTTPPVNSVAVSVSRRRSTGTDSLIPPAWRDPADLRSDPDDFGRSG